MSGLMDLAKGDADDLEGRVIIHGRVVELDASGDRRPDDFEGTTMALFCTTRPADFAEKFGAPAGGLEELARKQAEAAKEADAAGVLPMYGAPIDLDETDLTITPEDVIDVGVFTDQERCKAAIQLAAHMYLLRYSEQLQVRSGMPGVAAQYSAQADAETADEELEPPSTYDRVPRESMSDHLQAHYIGPIMHAIEDDNRVAALRLAHDLVRFCGPRGPLTDDAYALAAEVRAAPQRLDTKLVFKYFEKMLAVSDERFEDAARLRDDIRAYRAQGR